ncbi:MULTISPECIES: 5-carboxymethyl-2-hydroxymuconate Delta-isomerase [unclassified Pseudomonas]|uniref:5-carboxymethyl-2-hydroxymuconate Delta-isomerase n=1 Tax=unclassified Pseudomonas TaxID=196821 RepID=UPI0021C8AD82|nr:MULTISPECIES: 5-carboxymethyl-2-hydroxymuconate Delta-isomerase [unclassified Pseudomonas]MCU1730421.1 5-carboxymethyl-2-hydroxymuconate Delta-isomerase [Pseudomonas sp. 20P_3.2_Bac4]MCU1745636.1 5-carboxymethyl-2-hydroxymuconate Delta-isomerase [Pseudomonas sp. 20P_3.2_Bac5]
MPHCQIDCSRGVALRVGEQRLLDALHDAVDADGLFAPGDIKLRLNAHAHYRCGESREEFVHVTLYLLSGRDEQQRRALASACVGVLVALLPDVAALSVDVQEMRRETFVNRRQYLEQQRAPA